MAVHNITPEFRSAKEKFLLYYQKVKACKSLCSVPIFSTQKTGFKAVSARIFCRIPDLRSLQSFKYDHSISAFLTVGRFCYD